MRNFYTEEGRADFPGKIRTKSGGRLDFFSLTINVRTMAWEIGKCILERKPCGVLVLPRSSEENADEREGIY